ncbi:hypothetical protein [Pseudomonas sp. S2.OTC.A_B10]|uniref:hypothetical protein n=1 Tax=Pseudomonas sp. S2.OTC.A_B10 TaxID=3237018 RepID=UPI003CE77302
MSITDSVPELKARLKQLARIENTLRCLRQRALGPRRGFAMCAGAAAGCAIFAIAGELDVSGQVRFGGAVIAALLTAVIAYKQSKLPRTYVDRLDSQLAEYEPVASVAFAELQQHVRENRVYHVDRVNEWLDFERVAVSRAMPPQEQNKSEFLDRRL